MTDPTENLDDLDLFEVDSEDSLFDPERYDEAGADQVGQDGYWHLTETDNLELEAPEPSGPSITSLRHRERDGYEIEGNNLSERVKEVDQFFQDKEFEPVLYVEEDTHHAFMTRGDISRDQEVILGVERDFRKHLNDFEADDFDEYRGNYVSPASVQNVLLKMGVREKESVPTSLELNHSELRIPVESAYSPPERIPDLDDMVTGETLSIVEDEYNMSVEE